MKLYHCNQARSMRVVWALEEMRLDYELVSMQFPPRIFHKDYKAVNPLGTVPALVDGELVLTESAGICQYLGEKYGPTPLAVAPEEKDYGLYVNWLHRSDATLTFPLTLVLRYSALEPEQRRQPQVVEDYRAWFLGRWRSVEAGLEGRDYLCADRFTMADICVGYALHLALSLGVEEAMTPRVAAWRARLVARPAYRRAVEL
ncbi:glutathione S-transferase family protein [Amphiplicatus metriothermophilus]|uniref:Glutathione S-transferase n=1 Tax=Amphiplicatus metriothermophilus TaxID=1519374 RepID=A0A239PTA4_9PROT|nr:glutathione S-transferase family protein [Amphiplicatus metriothermophilus]MBB5519204.1 glutathione S-transferase [Amphiplicatus metriothermophilus]SNT73273.1 Glutathione S-transferase [Amphiplicatus metriothermophilus]